MKLVFVIFKGNSKVYTYKTKLNLIEGAVYDIVADNFTTYDNFILVKEIHNICDCYGHDIKHLREITNARLIQAPPKPDGDVDRFYINPEKKTTVVIWKDGKKTIVKCQDDEEFDFEKGIALCFMKKAFNNRGCYNDVFKEAIKQMESEE